MEVIATETWMFSVLGSWNWKLESYNLCLSLHYPWETIGYNDNNIEKLRYIWNSHFIWSESTSDVLFHLQGRVIKAYACGSQSIVSLCRGSWGVRSSTMNLPHSLSDQPSKSLSPGNSTVRMNDVPITTHAASSMCLDAAGPAWWRWRDNRRIKKGK